MKFGSETVVRSSGGGRTLVVMAKAPRPGMVKTRLAQSLPVEAVTELYRCLLDDTMELARSLGTVEFAIMCPASDVEELTRLARDGWPTQAWFWLEWGSSTAGQSVPAARSRFRVVHFDSISSLPHSGLLVLDQPLTSPLKPKPGLSGPPVVYYCPSNL